MLDITFGKTVNCSDKVVNINETIQLPEIYMEALIKAGFYRNTKSSQEMVMIDDEVHTVRVVELNESKRLILGNIVTHIQTTDFIKIKNALIAALNSKRNDCIIL